MWRTCAQCENHVPNVGNMCPMLGTMCPKSGNMCPMWPTCGPSRGTCVQCNAQRWGSCAQPGEHKSDERNMIGERMPNMGEHVRFFLKGHLGFEVCVFLPRAHFRVSSAAAAAVVLLFFADPLPIRQRCSSPALISHRLRNCKSGEYVCAAAMFCFLFFFRSVFFGFLGGEFFFFFFFLLHFFSFPFLGAVLLSFFRPWNVKFRFFVNRRFFLVGRWVLRFLWFEEEQWALLFWWGILSLAISLTSFVEGF